MNHYQFDVVVPTQRVRCIPSSFQLPQHPLRFRPLPVLGLTVLLNIVTLFSPLLSFQPETYSLKPLFSLHFVFGIPAAHAGDVRYIYDDLGRLIAVVDVTAGEAAIYQYDAVGNLLGIVRQPASAVSILNFTPKSGPIGTTVTLSGTGYSATASQNTVTFNGTPATVSSATATQLVVTVPAGATTGPIAVTTPTGSATSSTPFTVTSGSGPLGAPTITSFIPTIGTVGTAVSIDGTNFASTPAHNSVRFNIPQALVNTATPTTLTTAVPVGATSGRIRVATSLGVAVSPTDFFVPPPPYTATDVDSTGRITFGESKPVTVSTAAHIGLLVFDGTANQKASIVINTSTVGSCSNGNLSVLKPDGTTLASTGSLCTGVIWGPLVLPVGGTYTIVVDPSGTNTGQVTLTLHEVIDVTGPIAFGGTTMANLSTPGQRALWTFSGSATQKASIVINTSTVGSCSFGNLSVLKPDGTTLASTGSLCAGVIWGPLVLPVSGTYTIVADPSSTNTGQVTVALHEVVDITGSIAFGGSVSATLNTPGQRALWTFSGTANQRVSIVINTSTVGSCSFGNLSVLKPDGTTLASTGSLCAGVIWGPEVLLTAGTYTIIADPSSTNTGQVTVALHDVVDVTGPIAFGQTLTANLNTPGQRALWTFNGSANQKASIVINTSTVGSCSFGNLSVLKPDGTTLASTGSLCTGVIWGPLVLPTAGTYTIVADPSSTNTGQVTVALHNVVDVTGTLTIGAAPTGVTLTTPTQIASLTFAGTATQQVTVRVTGNTISSVTVKLLKPDGTTQTSSTSSAASFNLTQQTLATTGTYTVVVDPPGVNTGSLNVQVTSP